MSTPFSSLELVMEQNINLSASTIVLQPRASRPVLATEHALPRFPAAEYEAQAITDNRRYQCPAFASLSLAVGPVVAPPTLFSAPKPPSKAAVNPSQKKWISPSPVMPAIMATAVCDKVSESPFKSRRSSVYRGFFPDYERLPDGDNTSADPSDGAAMRKPSIVWFRKDLRIHDNEALFTASHESSSVLPVFIFDSSEYGKSAAGFGKIAAHHVQFLLQCVENLRQKLRELGSELVVRIGKPEEVLASLAKSIGANVVYAQEDISYNDLQTENKVLAALEQEGVDVKYLWGSTLLHINDLPFKMEDMPTTHPEFRGKVQNVTVRPTFETPTQLKGLPVSRVKPGDMPTLEELGAKIDSTNGQNLSPSSIGGETEALERFKRLCADYVKQADRLVKQQERNGEIGKVATSLHGSNFSCKISPWLSLGCISPRHIYEQLRTEKRKISAESNNGNMEYSLVYELRWRDFFRFIARKAAIKRFDTAVQTVCYQESGVLAA